MKASFFRQSFLLDSLDLAYDKPPLVQTLASGVTLQWHQRGVLEVRPAQDVANGQHIIVSSGIHGNETAPMELIDRLVGDIEAGRQTVAARCLFMVAHPEATNQHVRFIEQNLNRLFDNKPHEPSKERDIAEELKWIVAQFYAGTVPQTRWHLDLHCAIRRSKHETFAISPKTRHPVRSKALFDFVAHAQVEAVLLSNAPSSTFSWFSAEQFGAQALTLELGQVARLGENDLDRRAAFDQALRALIAGTTPKSAECAVNMYRVSRTIVRQHDDFNFLFDDQVENFTAFKHGEVFGHDGDKPLMAKNEEEAIVFPNRHVAVGQRAALMVCAVDTRYDDEDQLIYD